MCDLVPHPITYTALILAGGQGTRMGGRDKGWVLWQGKPLIEHVLSRIQAQTLTPSEVLISANRSVPDYALTGAQVVRDERPGFAGPLAGVEAGLLHAKSAWVLVVPCDMPCVPLDLAQRLFNSALNCGQGQHPWMVAVDGQPQPLCLAIPKARLSSLQAYLDAGGSRVKAWLDQQGVQIIAFKDALAFANINSIDEG